MTSKSLWLLLIFLPGIALANSIPLRVGDTTIEFPAIEGYVALSQQQPLVFHQLSWSKTLEIFVPNGDLNKVSHHKKYISSWPPLVIAVEEAGEGSGEISTNKWVALSNKFVSDAKHGFNPTLTGVFAFEERLKQRHTADEASTHINVTRIDAPKIYHETPSSLRMDYWLAATVSTGSSSKVVYELRTKTIAFVHNRLIRIKAFGISDSTAQLDPLSKRMDSIARTLTQANPNSWWVGISNWQQWNTADIMIAMLLLGGVVYFVVGRLLA